MPLTTRLVEVEMTVTELLKMEEKASGMSSRPGLMPDFLAMPHTTGTNNAVAAVLLMKALRLAAVTITAISSRFG